MRTTRPFSVLPYGQRSAPSTLMNKVGFRRAKSDKERHQTIVALLVGIGVAGSLRRCVHTGLARPAAGWFTGLVLNRPTRQPTLIRAYRTAIPDFTRRQPHLVGRVHDRCAGEPAAAPHAQLQSPPKRRAAQSLVRQSSLTNPCVVRRTMILSMMATHRGTIRCRNPVALEIATGRSQHGFLPSRTKSSQGFEWRFCKAR